MEGFAVRVRTLFRFISWSLGFFLALFAVFTVVEKWEDKNIAGRWLIRFDVNKDNYNAIIEESNTHEVFFIQNEYGVIGDGEKKEYNGASLPLYEYSKLEYQGIIDGSKLIAKYVLHDPIKVSFGNIVVDISDDGKQMKGTFIGSVSDMEGTVIGERLD